jgi:hypothetical protein
MPLSSKGNGIADAELQRAVVRLPRIASIKGRGVG